MNIFRRIRRVAPALSDEQLAVAWQLSSVLLDYPTLDLQRRVPALLDAADSLPPAVGEPLGRLLQWIGESDIEELHREYVETFDHTRSCCLYLTYYYYGDTRRRGVALVQFKQAFRRSGAELEAAELPDHLGVVLEFGATYDRAAAWRLLADYRAGVEMLRLALTERESPWADAAAAVCATLPKLSGDEHEAMARLIAQGPPREDVGLQAYALDPRLNPHPDDDPDRSEPVNLGPSIPVGNPVGVPS